MWAVFMLQFIYYITASKKTRLDLFYHLQKATNCHKSLFLCVYVLGEMTWSKITWITGTTFYVNLSHTINCATFILALSKKPIWCSLTFSNNLYSVFTSKTGLFSLIRSNLRKKTLQYKPWLVHWSIFLLMLCFYSLWTLAV